MEVIKPGNHKNNIKNIIKKHSRTKKITKE